MICNQSLINQTAQSNQSNGDVEFSRYCINDLITHIKAFKVGIGIGHEKVAVMLYADGWILGKDELELQWLLDELGKWCAENKEIEDESKIVHFRTKSSEPTNFSFKCDETELETITQYTGLGYLLSIKHVIL